ncbi:MAG: 50S ribosomal protein L4 [Candidatus Peribacteraceae bacterium]|jgi:large subunit ribosomal protein L4
MNVDVYSATGQKTGTMELPAELFAAPVNRGLMHQAMVMQRSNARSPIAHAKSRSEVVGSTRKVYGQKHTGRARRGPIRSPVMRGGGKAFGPKKERNFTKEMPKSMRRAALCACLSFQAKRGAVIGLEAYPETIKTKEAMHLLGKLPVEQGRRTLIVTAAPHKALTLSTRNIPGVKTLLAAYLNPLDILTARHVIFMKGAVEKAVEVFVRRNVRVKVESASEEKNQKMQKKQKSQRSAEKKASSSKTTKTSSASSASSATSASSASSASSK